jgi:hypothetical protein
MAVSGQAGSGDCADVAQADNCNLHRHLMVPRGLARRYVTFEPVPVIPKYTAQQQLFAAWLGVPAESGVLAA